ALAAALAVARIDEEPEGPAVEAAPRRQLAVFLGLGEPRLELRRARHVTVGALGDPLRELGPWRDHTEDRAVRAGGHAGHAADAALGEELRDAGRELAEVADGGRSRGD